MQIYISYEVGSFIPGEIHPNTEKINEWDQNPLSDKIHYDP